MRSGSGRYITPRGLPVSSASFRFAMGFAMFSRGCKRKDGALGFQSNWLKLFSRGFVWVDLTMGEGYELILH